MEKNQTIGILISGFIAAIIGLILLQSIAVYVEQGTRANSGVATQTNRTITISGLSSGGIVELPGQELVSTLVVTNGSTVTAVPTTNYTIAECVRTSDGLKGICYTKTTAGNAFPTVNVSYTYYPDGYIDDAGGRSIAGLIVILAALAIGAVGLWVALGNQIREFLDI